MGIGGITWNNPWPLVPEITVPNGPLRPEYAQPDPTVGYKRPMSRETAVRLLTEGYKINKIEEDVKPNKGGRRSGPLFSTVGTVGYFYLYVTLPFMVAGLS